MQHTILAHMKSIGAFFKRAGLPVLLILLVAASGYAFYLYWSDPRQLQNIGVLASFAIAAVLAAVTWQYAHATEQTLELFREQWKSQQCVHIRFGMKVQDGRARVWVRNLGTSQFMVTKAVFTNGDLKTKNVYLHMVVAPSAKAGFFVPDELWEHYKLFGDINLTLYYESATQGTASASKAYNFEISMGHPKKVRKIYKGIKRWYAECPKCKLKGETFNRSMDTTGLENFAQAMARQKIVESEFETTCPAHQSAWEVTTELMHEHHRNREIEYD